MTDRERPTARLYPRIPHLPGSRLGPSERHAGAAVVARMTVAAAAAITASSTSGGMTSFRWYSK